MFVALHPWQPDQTSSQNAKAYANGKASLDWLIAAHMATTKNLLVSDDQGVEFKPLREANQVLSRENVEQLLNDRLADAQVGSKH